MMARTMSRPECEAVLARLPDELHRLFMWLATGQDPASKQAA